MAQLPRVVIVDVVHHVTQRGNGRQFILASEAERRVYLDLLRQAVHQQGVSGESFWRLEKRKPSYLPHKR